MSKKRTNWRDRGASKFRAIKTTVDGIEFASKKEAKDYEILKMRVAAGDVKDLKLQVPFDVELAGKHICTYKADFCYYEKVGSRWRYVVQDTKGFRTAVYRIKKKLVEAQFGITIRET